MSGDPTRPRRSDVRHDAPEAYRALAALTRASALDPRIAELVKIRASQINGCAYCVDLHTGLARRSGEDERRLSTLVTWRETPFFDDRERAALALTESLLHLSAGPVEEQVYAEAARLFEGPELSHLVVTIAAIGAWNMITIAAGTAPRPLES